MHRVADVTLFRAVGAWLDWPALVRHRREMVQEWPRLREDLERVEGRHDVRLVWSCRRELGVPHRAFTVWQRRTGRVTHEVETRTSRIADGELLTWGGLEAACVQVRCTVADPGRPVGLFLLRGGGASATAALAADVRHPDGRASLTLQARCAGATSAVLVNAEAVGVLVLPLQEAVEADDWQELEHVGLPVREPLRDYATDPQGLVAGLVDPHEAALQRLDRGGPPLGWWPVTEFGLLAPPWSPPDPRGLVEEAQAFLLPEVQRLYTAGLPEHQQHLLLDDRDVQPPSQDGRVAGERATARTAPLGTLLVAAGTDPSACLALGFGSAYQPEHLLDHPAEVEFLVTGHYRHSPVGDDVELAAYVPPVPAHVLVPPVVDLTAARAALLPPPARDGAHRESIEVSWRPRQGTAVLTDPVALALASFAPGDTEAVSRLAERPGGGPQLRALAVPVKNPDAPPPPPGRERPRLVDPELPLPLEGPVTRGYCVAQVDPFGVWSRWEDVAVTTHAPVVLPPRIGRLELTARHVAGPVCPSRLVVEVAIDWTERSPARVDVVALLYPMPTGDTPPPVGVTAASPAPTGGHRVDAAVLFSGDVPSASAGTVVPLREDGSVAPVPGPVEQGTTARSYRLTLDGPGLDFAPVSRWGVQVWVQETATGIGAPSVWSPDLEHPATAVAASPVPAVPVPPPQPPGVPLGSTPDAQGCSHVRVAWSGLTSPQVDRVVVWEASETALRRRLAPASPGDRGELPGWRLQQLWDLYEAAPAEARPLAFRRLAEVPASPAATDVALPRGSEDIHVFVVTAVTTTGLESPWPAASGGTPARAHLQSFMAPRLRRPAMPLVRPAVRPDGTVQVQLEVSSPVEVTAFEVFATRSAVAAREHLTMGPPVASVPASTTTRTDRITGDPVYEAVWSGGLAPSWDAWHVRAVAVPRATVDEAAVRGRVSVASDVVSVGVRPPGPPDLAPLAAEVVGADHRGVLLRTSTAAPDRPVEAGSHRLVVEVDGTAAAPVALEATAAVPDDSTRPDTSAGPVVQRLPRTGGRTGLLVWTERADPTAVQQVGVRLVDPLGRSAEQSLAVPGWVDPRPDLTLEVVDGFRITGRGWVLEVVTSARASEVPPHELAVLATGAGGPVWPPRPRPRRLSADWRLPDIPRRRTPVPPRTPRITATRADLADGTRIALWIPLTALQAVQLVVQHPDHGRVRTTWRP